MTYRKATPLDLPMVPPSTDAGGVAQAHVAPANPMVGPPGLAELLPWLLLQVGNSENGGASGGSLPPEKSDPKLAHLETQAPAPEGAKELGGTSQPSKYVKAPKAASSWKPARAELKGQVAESKELPTTQSRSAVQNPPVTPEGVAPINRSADRRDDSAAVSRAVDNAARRYVKRTALVHPQERLAEAARIRRFVLKPRGPI